MRRLPLVVLAAAGLAALAALLAAPPAGAMCVAARGPRLLDATVVACEGSRERLVAALGEGSAAVDRHGAAAPVVLTVEPARYRQMNMESVGSAEFTIGPWTDLPAEEGGGVATAYLLSSPEADCAVLAAGERVFVVEVLTCCDTVPPQDAACVLDLPEATLPPAELAAAAGIDPHC